MFQLHVLSWLAFNELLLFLFCLSYEGTLLLETIEVAAPLLLDGNLRLESTMKSQNQLCACFVYGKVESMVPPGKKREIFNLEGSIL